MTIVHDPSLGMELSRLEIGGGANPFMAPELLVPSKFGLGKCIPTKEADIYAISMVIYEVLGSQWLAHLCFLILPVQVLTGTTPFGKQTGLEVVLEVFGRVRPSKPPNALDLGLSDKVWKLLRACWRKNREYRPPVKDVLVCVKSAASVCGTLPPVGGIVQRYKDIDQVFNEISTSLSWSLGYI